MESPDAMKRLVDQVAAEVDRALFVSIAGPAAAPIVTPSTNAAKSKKQWMEANPDFKLWRPQGLLSMTGWKDIGWVTNDGRFIPEGESRFTGGLHLNSYGDTLYVVPKGASKVAREQSMIS